MNPLSALSGLLDSAVVADETSVERATQHPASLKRKRIIKEMRLKERFQKPTPDGTVFCPLCEWGPIGSSEDDNGDSEMLTIFGNMYRTNVGNMESLHMYRKMKDFWNEHIATQEDEMDTLEPGETPLPMLRVCDLQHHYEKCCVNIDRILLTQLDDILQVQDALKNNGLYVIAVDADDEEEIGASEDLYNPRPTKKQRPLVNHKCAAQWREYNRSLVYTLKAYADCRNADYRIPRSVTKGNGSAAGGKGTGRRSTGSSTPGPTQRDKATFGKNY